jgi:hypothetical protein
MSRGVLPLAIVVVCFVAGRAAHAQEPPPPIGPFVVDLHGIVPNFGSDPQVAASRGLTLAELPGAGLGFIAGGHVYVAKVLAVTIGVGGELMLGRSHGAVDNSQTPPVGAVSERLTVASPVLSLNFGNGNGWSYLFFGLGESVWSIVPDGAQPLPIDQERKRILSYGAGARWFIRKRVAFSLDVRTYNISAGPAQSGGTPGTPHMQVLVVGAGISVKVHPPREPPSNPDEHSLAKHDPDDRAP